MRELPPPVRLGFDRGTLTLSGLPAESAPALPGVLWDPRVRVHRAPAFRYAEVVQGLRARGRPFVDAIRPGSREGAPAFSAVDLRSYQQAALTSWQLAGCRGLVVLPTGSGKTRVAIAAMAATGARVLCLVPTRVLLHQWASELSRWHLGPVGRFGDGHRSLEAVTVATFESGVRHASTLGALFDLVIVDEVHHFGARIKDEALEMSVAPFRLGLTATLPADAVQVSRLVELVGPVVFRLSVSELAGTYLAAFDTRVFRTSLDRDERAQYEREHAVFQAFRRAFRGVHPEGSWQDFVSVASQSDEGRRALASWRRTRQIVAFPKAKRRLLGELLARHRDARVLVFTPDNETAYAIARAHLVAPLTCDIKRKERDEVLDRFRRGELTALVSSRVLNEGLDVPDAEVAVIVGGAQGEREHVQRVGRLLRPAPGKRAIVYELVVTGTSESFAATKRRRALFAGSGGG
jgi:superfamily II DNA or RNA helicase